MPPVCFPAKDYTNLKGKEVIIALLTDTVKVKRFNNVLSIVHRTRRP